MILRAFNGRHVGEQLWHAPRHCGCRRCDIARAIRSVIPTHKMRHLVESTVR